MAKRRPCGQPRVMGRLYFEERVVSQSLRRQSLTILSFSLHDCSGMAFDGPLSPEVKQHVTPKISTPETVPLHHLCEECRIFCESWQVLYWFQDAAGSDHQTRPYSSLLCTVKHLIQCQQHCHFCELLLASLNRWSFIKRYDVLDKNVYLHSRDRGEEFLVVHALFCEEEPMDEEMGRQFASFALEGYRGMCIPKQLDIQMLSNS